MNDENNNNKKKTIIITDESNIKQGPTHYTTSNDA